MSRLLWLVMVMSVPALAQEEDGGVPAEAVAPVVEAPAPKEPLFNKVVDVTGYGMSRTQFTRARTWGPLPTNDIPQLQQFVEFNTQLKVSVRPHSYFSSDVSVVANWGGFYRGVDGTGNEVSLADKTSPQVQPIININELFISHEFIPELNVLIGKKRIVWGPGSAFNPTDLLNPRRDPTDPTFQRSGAWLAQIEAPLSFATFSFVFAPTVLKQTASIPTNVLGYPAWDQKDTQLHYQLAARAYALILDTDINVMFFFGNKSVDDFQEKPRVGLSFSHVFGALEVHGEALFQTGSTRDYLNSACVQNVMSALQCSIAKTAYASKTHLNDTELRPKILVGGRYQFSDDSLLSLEYLYQHDGWNKDHFQDFANALGLVPEARSLGVDVANFPGASAVFGGTSADGLPVRFAFDPRGRHYAFLTYQKPRIFEDFILQAVVIANLRDLSTTITPSITWSATEWLNLSVLAFVPLQGPDALAVKTPQGLAVSEFGVTPFAFRAMFEARAFF